MGTKITEGQVASVARAAQALCASKGNFAFAQMAADLRLDRQIVRACLALLVRRGVLLAWPGERFAQPVARPGSSWPTDLRAPVRALMGAR